MLKSIIHFFSFVLVFSLSGTNIASMNVEPAEASKALATTNNKVTIVEQTQKKLALFLYQGPVAKTTDPILITLALTISQASTPIIASKQLIDKLRDTFTAFQATAKEWINQGKNPKDEIKKILHLSTAIMPIFDEIKSRPEKETSDILSNPEIKKAKDEHIEAMEAISTFFITTIISDFFNNPNAWSMYEQTTGNLVLLTPQKNVPMTQESNLEDLGLRPEIFTQKNNVAQLNRCADSSLQPTAEEIYCCFQKETTEWNILLIGHGKAAYKRAQNGRLQHNCVPTIAELTVNEFQLLLNFFNTEIQVNTLSYKSCHAGGQNSLLFLTDPRSGDPIKLNFDVLCMCLNNMPILFSFTEYALSKNETRSISKFRTTNQENCYQNKDIIKIINEKAAKFFDTISFFKGIEKYGTSSFFEDLTDGVQALTGQPSNPAIYKKITQLPLIRKRQSERFEPLLLPATADKIVYVMSKDNLLCTSEQSYLPVMDVVNKDCIILDTIYVNKQLNITTSSIEEKAPFFVSTMPLETLHTIESVKINKPTHAFFEDSFFAHPLRSTHEYIEIPFSQIYLIKHLETSEGKYKNVIILYNAIDEKISVVTERFNDNEIEIGELYKNENPVWQLYNHNPELFEAISKTAKYSYTQLKKRIQGSPSLQKSALTCFQVIDLALIKTHHNTICANSFNMALPSTTKKVTGKSPEPKIPRKRTLESSKSTDRKLAYMSDTNTTVAITMTTQTIADYFINLINQVKALFD